MLTKGQTFRLNGAMWRVAYVTPSRAHCRQLGTRTVTIQGRTFRAHATETLDLAPDAMPELLREEFTHDR